MLRQNLFTLRSVISQYTLDKQKAPQSLDDLVSGGLFEADSHRSHDRQQPTGRSSRKMTLMSVDQQEPGINDVHSASDADRQRRHRV